jgi:hypothetical protein
VSQPNPPTLVNLPEHFHPILVDRMVKFIYTSNYKFDPTHKGNFLGQDNFKIYHATFIPAGTPPSSAVTALVGIPKHMFNLRIYALAAELKYPHLKAFAFAFDALVYSLLKQRGHSPKALKEVVDATFAPLDTEARLCKDEDGLLQNFAVVAVIGHEVHDTLGNKWQREFTELLQEPAYEAFWSAYRTVKEESLDLFDERETEKKLTMHRKEARRARRAAAKVNDEDVLKRLGVSPSSIAKTSDMGRTRKKATRKKMLQDALKASGTKGGANGDTDGDVEME